MSTSLGLLLEMRPKYLGVQMDALVNRGLSTLAAIERQKNATKKYPLPALFETNDALGGELENPKRPRWKQYTQTGVGKWVGVRAISNVGR